MSNQCGQRTNSMTKQEQQHNRSLGCLLVSAMRNAYMRWLMTQGVKGDSQIERTGWLIEHEALFSRRAPGNTCLSALRRKGGENNDSKGCGGIMRVAPCGILHAGDPGKAF